MGLYTVADFRPGTRVQLHPGTDLWAQGARFGTVTRTTRQRVYVRLDRTGRVVALAPGRLTIEED